MRNDLLKAISRQKDLTNVILLTFNIDLIFVETVLLRALKQCGHPSLTVFADAEEVSRTFDAQGRWLAGIGRRFRVVPVAMAQGYCFHPKAVLLSGPDHAELLVGSGNLTFGGYRQNDEVWTSFSSSEDGTGPLAAFREMLHACVEQSQASRGARREVAEAFDAATRLWAGGMAPPDGLVWRVGHGRSLLEQMASTVGDRRVDRLLVCSPYFDKAGAALRGLARVWSKASVELLVQPGHSTLTRAALASAAIQPRLLTAKSGRPGDGGAFIHAKFYAMFSGEEVLLFSGSANCSAAALALKGDEGNAEMLAFRRMAIREFEEQVLSELRMIDEMPEIPQEADEDEPQDDTVSILIHNASYEGGTLTVSFITPADVKIDKCWVDDSLAPLAPSAVSTSTVTLPLTQVPRFVRLEGISKGTRVFSRRHWVDYEFVLGATSRQRKLAQAIEGSIAPASWSFGSWTEVMRLLGDHLRYEPTGSHQQGCAPRHEDGAAEKAYSAADFFTSDYRLPSRRPSTIFEHEDNRILGLQRLLLDYFGVDTEDANVQTGNEDGQDDEEAVDRPEAVVAKGPQSLSRKKSRQELTEAEQRKARRTAEKVIEQLLQERFLRHRPEALLANDLTIVSVLLVAGRNENWLSDDLFFKLTYDVWTRLFFDHGLSGPDGGNARGWLQLRTEAAGNTEAFRQAMGTIPLSAALAMWAFTCPVTASKPEKARFALATRLAVARLPWLWNLPRIDEVAAEIDRIASRTGWFHDGKGKTWGDLSTQWNRLLGEGLALARFEQVLAQRTLQEWRETIEARELDVGTLLWQPREIGFAVTTKRADCRSDKAAAVPVLLLRAEKREANIQPSYMLPVRQLLRSVSAEGQWVTSHEVEMLTRFVDQIEQLLGHSQR